LPVGRDAAHVSQNEVERKVWYGMNVFEKWVSPTT
jgi:hypothetical protein